MSSNIEAQQPLKHGERSFFRFVPVGREDLPVPEYTGSRNVEGGAYLFHFPFDIFVEESLAEIQTMLVESTWVDIYPPFFNGSEPIDPPQVALESIPWKPGTLSPDFDRVRIKDANIAQRLGIRANAMRIDCRPDRGHEFAVRILNQFIGLARWWTAQWWIGRDRRPNVDYLRNWFPTNEVGERLEGIHGFLSMYGNFGIEWPLDVDRFRSIRGNITNGRVIPLSWDTFFDSIYFHATGQLRRAVLEVAIACEAKIGEEAVRVAERDGISKSRLKRALASDDFTVQLVRGVAGITNRAFDTEQPEDFEQLKLIRTVRGNVAHGGQALVPAPAGTREVTGAEVFSMLRSALTLLLWLEKL